MNDRPVRYRKRPSNRAETRAQSAADAVSPGGGDSSEIPFTGAPVKVLPAGAGHDATSPETQPTEPAFAIPTQADIYQAVLSELQPVGIIEETWCRDIARNIHHSHRLRTLRDGYLQAARTRVIHDTMRTAIKNVVGLDWDSAHVQEASNLASVVKLGREKAGENGFAEQYATGVRKLSSVGVDIKDLTSLAYVNNMTKVEALEKLIVVTDHRRDVLVRDLENRRANAARGQSTELRHIGRGSI